MSKSAIAIQNSDNKKLGGCATTYASLHSCPKDCPFATGGCGCYGMHARTGIIFKRLSLDKKSPIQIAQEEKEAISKLPGTKHLRLHTVGDASTRGAAKLLSKAADEYIGKSITLNSPVNVFTYTHAWRRIPKADWGNISVIASCENITQAKQAMRRGYAASIVMNEFKSDKAWTEDGMLIIPCMEQCGRSVSCNTCKLCFTANKLLARRAVIAFKLHGPTVQAKGILNKGNKS